MPHDALVQQIVAKIDADIAERKREIADLGELRAHVLRFNGNGSQKAEPGMSLFKNHELHGPHRPTLKIGVAASNSNRGVFRAVLRDAGKSLRAKQVWEEAARRGAVTNSPNPVNATHGSLYAMLGKGVKRVGKGRFAFDPATAPSEEDAPDGETRDVATT